MPTKLPFILLTVVAALTAVATFLSDSTVVYGAWWFSLAWALVGACGAWMVVRCRLWRRPAVFTLHVAMLVILLGALLTRLTSHRGTLHLRQGIPSSSYQMENGEDGELPTLVRLDTFIVHCYAGTQAPMGYESRLTWQGQQHSISMNHIGRVGDYRLYQTSYDPDRLGTILSVNYDPWGTPVTYAGYTLFLLAFLAMLVKGRKPRAFFLFVLAFHLSTLSAEALPVVPRAKADSLERQLVVWNSRLVPVGVVAHDFLQKVYGRGSYKGLTPTQVVTSWTLAPREWNAEPVIKEKRNRYHSFNEFVDFSTPTPTLKGLGRNGPLDEKVALVLMLQQGTWVSAPTADMPRPDPVRISLELFYARTSWSLVGIALCVLCLVLMGLRRFFPLPSSLIMVAKGCALLFLAFHFVLRWYLSGHVPLTTTFETLHFVALCILVGSVVSRRSSPVNLASAVVVLFVAWLVERNPQITPLMPVLHSPWLSAHVATVMLAYALLVMSFFQRHLLRWAVGLLAIGIWLGAVWANVSWGAYWTWDPKESWALVTLIVYSIPLHTGSLPWFRSVRHYRLYSLLALATLLMTYFGVNYLLGGLHSYG